MAADPWQLTRIEAQAPTPKAWVEAKKLANGGAFRDIGPNSQYRRAWQATTRGSSGTYTTTIVEQASELAFACDCPSHQYPCKHALGLAYYLATRPELRPEPEPPPAVADELDALVRACFANPKHNLPRLVLADYVEERGDTDRATILRIQCEFTPPKKKGEKPKIGRGMAKPLKEAIARVTERFGPDLLARPTVEFRRGFLTLDLSFHPANSASRDFDRLLELLRTGWVETVSSFYYHGIQSPELTAALRGVGVIDLSRSFLTDEALMEVATEFRVGRLDSRLRQVIVPPRQRATFARLLGTATAKTPRGETRQSYHQLTPERFRLLLDSGVLDGVEHLALGGDLGPDGLRQFAEGSAGRRLRSLSLWPVQPDAVNLRALWQLRAARLSELTLNAVPLGDAGVVDLCAGSLIPRDDLALRAVGLTSAGAIALAQCPKFSSLRTLDLRGNEIGLDGIAALLNSPHLPRLAGVVAFGSNTDLAILPALFAAAPRPSLGLSGDSFSFTLHRPSNGAAQLSVRGEQRLGWPEVGVCPEPLARLTLEVMNFEPADWRRLRAWLAGQSGLKLSLQSCHLRNDDVPELLELVEQVRPTELNLGNNEIGVKGCQALAESPALACVRVLRLHGNPIRLNGAMAIAGSSNRGKLRSFTAVGLGRTLSAAERKQLTAAFKGVKLSL